MSDNKVKKTMGGISINWNKKPLEVNGDFEVRIMDWSPKIRRMGYVVVNRETNVVELETTMLVEAVSFSKQSNLMLNMPDNMESISELFVGGDTDDSTDTIRKKDLN